MNREEIIKLIIKECYIKEICKSQEKYTVKVKNKTKKK